MSEPLRVRSQSRHRFVQELEAREHHWLADKPRGIGGHGLGPSPLELLLGSFAAHTAVGILDLAIEKEWAVDSVNVELAAAEGDSGGVEEDVAGAQRTDDGSRSRGENPHSGGGNPRSGGSNPHGDREGAQDGPDPSADTEGAHGDSDLSGDTEGAHGGEDTRFDPFMGLVRRIHVKGELNEAERRELETSVAERWPRESWLPPGELRDEFTYD
jgi:uncharacterized OsmC-like protein